MRAFILLHVGFLADFTVCNDDTRLLLEKQAATRVQRVRAMPRTIMTPPVGPDAERKRTEVLKQESLHGWKGVLEKMDETAAASSAASEAERVIQHKKEGEALLYALKYILGALMKARTNTANMEINRIVPTIMVHGVEYQRVHFQRMLKEKMILLDGTEKWLEKNLEDIFRRVNNLKKARKGEQVMFYTIELLLVCNCIWALGCCF